MCARVHRTLSARRLRNTKTGAQLARGSPTHRHGSLARGSPTHGHGSAESSPGHPPERTGSQPIKNACACLERVCSLPYLSRKKAPTACGLALPACVVGGRAQQSSEPHSIALPGAPRRRTSTEPWTGSHPSLTALPCLAPQRRGLAPSLGLQAHRALRHHPPSVPIFEPLAPA